MPSYDKTKIFLISEKQHKVENIFFGGMFPIRVVGTCSNYKGEKGELNNEIGELNEMRAK
jgi:hypothetical protein